MPSSGLLARTPQTEAAMQAARSGDIDRAVELIEKATGATPGDADAKLPNDPTLRFHFARTAAMSGQQLTQALAHLEELTGIDHFPVTLSRAGI